jgi:hypothetical protein
MRRIKCYTNKKESKGRVCDSVSATHTHKDSVSATHTHRSFIYYQEVTVKVGTHNALSGTESERARATFNSL